MKDAKILKSYEREEYFVCLTENGVELFEKDDGFRLELIKSKNPEETFKKECEKTFSNTIPI